MPGLGWDRRSPVWLLDYDVGGRVYRFGSGPAEVTTAGGDTLVYQSGLGGLELGTTRQIGRVQVPVSISSEVDWSLLVARGIDLDRRGATLRLWYDGDNLELADVYARGTTEDVSYGVLMDPLSVSIVSDPETGALVLPDLQAHVSDPETWPVRAGYYTPTGVAGMNYPIVVGYPGDHPKVGATDIAEPAFRVPMVEQSNTPGTDSRWVAALGSIDAAKIGLYLWGANWEYTESATIGTTTDALGRLVTYAQYGSLDIDGTNFYAGLRNASGYGGGVSSPYSGGVLRDAHEVIRYFLDLFVPGVAVDRSRMSAVGAWLSRFKLDFALTSPTNVAQFVQSELLPLLPVLGVDGPNGYYLAPLRWDATALDAVAWLSVDRGQIRLDGRVGNWREPTYNLFTLGYRINAATERASSSRTLSAVYGNVAEIVTSGANLPPFASSLPWLATTEQDTRIYGSSLCRWSQTRYGVLEWSRDTSVVWDDATAAHILYYLAAKHAYPKRQARYVGGQELRTLGPGDVVVISHDALHLDEVPALVIERTTSVASVALDVVLLEHPLYRARSTV